MQGWSLELSTNKVGMIPGSSCKGLRTIQALFTKHCDIKRGGGGGGVFLHQLPSLHQSRLVTG